MTTLVTGGSGFIGVNIVKSLAQRNHRVVSFDLVSPDELVNRYLEPWKDQVIHVQGDILDRTSLDQLTAHGITHIVHAAVFTGILPEIEVRQSHSIVDINVMGTTNLLELARQLPTERFLYVSSGSVYGQEQKPGEVLQEDGPLYPRSLYAATKYASELLTRRYGELHGFQTVSVRLGGPYGPMERVSGHRANQSILKEWTGNAIRAEPIRVIDTTVGRQFTYVTDIAEGILTVLEAPSLAHDVYNNSGSQWSTLGEVISVLRKLQPNLQVEEEHSGAGGGVTLSQTLTGQDSMMDVSRLQKDTGFVAGFDLATGLGEYMKWREAYHYTD